MAFNNTSIPHQHGSPGAVCRITSQYSPNSLLLLLFCAASAGLREADHRNSHGRKRSTGCGRHVVITNTATKEVACTLHAMVRAPERPGSLVVRRTRPSGSEVHKALGAEPEHHARPWSRICRIRPQERPAEGHDPRGRLEVHLLTARHPGALQREVGPGRTARSRCGTGAS